MLALVNGRTARAFSDEVDTGSPPGIAANERSRERFPFSWKRKPLSAGSVYRKGGTGGFLRRFKVLGNGT
jgi:hypothetical protein